MFETKRAIYQLMKYVYVPTKTEPPALNLNADYWQQVHPYIRPPHLTRTYLERAYVTHVSSIAGSFSLFSMDTISPLRDISAGLPSLRRVVLAAELQLTRTGRLVRSTANSYVQSIMPFLTELTGHGNYGSSNA
jgi:hypothetical protein